MTQRLDALFAGFQPAYKVPLKCINVGLLPPWTTRTVKQPPPFLPSPNVRGPLEREVVASFGLHEVTATYGLSGRGPAPPG